MSNVYSITDVGGSSIVHEGPSDMTTYGHSYGNDIWLDGQYKFGAQSIVNIMQNSNDLTLILEDGRVISVRELDQRLSDLEARLDSFESDKEFKW